MARAALFDMDRTLIRGDSASCFVKHQHSKGEADVRDLLRVGWWLLQYTLGTLDIENVATLALSRFRGRTEEWMRASCDEMFERYLSAQIRDASRKAIEDHRRRGHVVAIVTGAADYVARPLAAELGIQHVVGTRLEVVDGIFTGRAISPMCYGAGKVIHVLEMGRRLDFRLGEATFYTDSITDLPLLERVRDPVVINPDARLRWVAHCRKWPIQRW
jgi:HAD superfamily hydrolase (TIGR01490 family)